MENTSLPGFMRFPIQTLLDPTMKYWSVEVSVKEILTKTFWDLQIALRNSEDGVPTPLFLIRTTKINIAILDPLRLMSAIPEENPRTM